jgi:cytoskeletal protein CcmA (bactofilin family)
MNRKYPLSARLIGFEVFLTNGDFLGMFRQPKRTEETSGGETAVQELTREERDMPLPLVRRTGEATEPSGALARPDALRRPGETAAPALRRPVVAQPTEPKSETAEGKRLIVGREICVRGEITACDVLVVEGRVEASIAGSNLLEIAATGLFKGDAEIEHAEIAGRFEGNLTVRDRLFIAATGRVTGSVRYRRLEIALGGELIGDAQSLASSRSDSTQD